MIRTSILKKYSKNFSKSDKEHVTKYFYNNSNKFKIKNFTFNYKSKIKNFSVDTKKDLNEILKNLSKKKFKTYSIKNMKVKAAVIGMGIGEKHLKAIDGFLGSEVKIICEKDKKNSNVKKKYPNKMITSNEKSIFLDKQINLVSIASYDDNHYSQIVKCLKFNKNIIIEKPMCLNSNQLKNIYKLIKKKY